MARVSTVCFQGLEFSGSNFSAADRCRMASRKVVLLVVRQSQCMPQFGPIGILLSPGIQRSNDALQIAPVPHLFGILQGTEVLRGRFLR